MGHCMKKLKVLCVSMMILLSSCYSAPTPIIIRSIPQADVSDDMSVEEYMRSSTEWAVQITAYVKELINQIRHKSPYIDLRSGEK